MAPTDEPKTYTQDQVEELLNATAEKAAEAAVQKVLSATAGKAERDELGETLASYSDIRKLRKPPGGTLFMSPDRLGQLPRTLEELAADGHIPLFGIRDQPVFTALSQRAHDPNNTNKPGAMLYEIWIVFTIIGILELALMVAQGVTDGLSALSSAADPDDQILDVLLLPAMASLIYLLTWALKVAQARLRCIEAFAMASRDHCSCLWTRYFGQATTFSTHDVVTQEYNKALNLR